jgi:Beta-propeller repeat
MSLSSAHTRNLSALVLALALWVGWKGAKDWVPLSTLMTNPTSPTSIQPASVPSSAVQDMKPTRARSSVMVSATYGRLPLSFEANQGQVDSKVKYLSRGQGYGLFLTATEAVLQLPIPESRISNDEGRMTRGELRIPNFEFRTMKNQSMLPHRKLGLSNQQSSSLQMKLVGANANAQVEGVDQLPGKTNYFIGNEPAKWWTNIPTYSKVRYKEVYPGIDLVYYGNQGKLEYDWVVAPGADPGRIVMRFEGVSGQQPLRIDAKGDLLIPTSGGELRQHKPLVYQNGQEVCGFVGSSRGEEVSFNKSGTPDPVSKHFLGAQYRLNPAGEVTFEIAFYDRSQPLILDPVLTYSTYLGGGADSGTGIAVDSIGNAYVTGWTYSSSFPIAGVPFQGAKADGNNSDAFVLKLDPTESVLLYSTYLGGTADDAGRALSVDALGNAYVTGSTSSANFPTVAAIQPVRKGEQDAFVTKLGSTGSTLIYSTFFGGSGNETGYGIAVDSAGNGAVAGETSSTDFPMRNALQSIYGGGSLDGFVTKLNPAGTAVIFSTYLGGNESDHGSAIVMDVSGNAYVAGSTSSLNFPIANPLRSSLGGDVDAFVTKLNSSGTTLWYSTYLGGKGAENGTGIAVDASSNAYVTGWTTSDDFPTTNPVQASRRGRQEGFVAKLNAAGSTLVYSTYLGGSEDEWREAIAVDIVGNVYVTGTTASNDFPLVNSLQTTLCWRKAFVTKLSASGSLLEYSSVLGGSQLNEGEAIAVDGAGNAYLTGWTNSHDFPTTPRAVQSSLVGDSNLFIAKISGEQLPPLQYARLFVPIVLSSSGMNNSFFTSELTLTNRGTKDALLDFDYVAAFGNGSGHGTDSLRAGQQKIVPDAIAYLKSIGVPLPDSGNRGGTLTVSFSRLSSPTDAAVMVRTTTSVVEGRAGLAYAGITSASALTGASYLFGLRQNAVDRSNVAIQNAGTPADGEVVLELTVFSGDAATPISSVLPPETLSPGGFRQISGILQANGLSLTNGYVRVERLSGKAPYYAYAVINDQTNSDGSFIPAIPESTLIPPFQLGMTIPAIVETSAFSSELILTNLSNTPATVQLGYIADPFDDTYGSLDSGIDLRSGEQSIIPNFVQFLRDHGHADALPPGPTYAGLLLVRGAGPAGVLVGARASTPGGGGRYGVFYAGVYNCQECTNETWLYGLQQNDESRTNLALVNVGGENPYTDVFSIELFDGQTGRKVNTVDGVAVKPYGWLQIGSVLAHFAPETTQGYAHIVRTSGASRFIAYAVINDGGQPGQRSGDGAFISSAP